MRWRPGSRTTPGFAAELTPPQQQLRLARYTFQMQLQNLRERVISAWEESRGIHTVARTTVIVARISLRRARVLHRLPHPSSPPHPTREMMQAITARQEAVCDALQARLEQLEAQERELNNTLSLGTGPLVSEGKSKSKSKYQQGKTNDRRRDFLGDDPPALSIQERIDMKK